MAEKKVSGKNKKITTGKQNISISARRNADYDAFLAKYGQELRKRNTRTVPEPKQHQLRADEIDKTRCGEIDPHTTVNPAAEHQILTKRTGRILSDDTGFKAMSYNDRFELKAEMPELADNDSIAADSGFDDSTVPGQQTMADMVTTADGEIETSVPVEAQISEDENPFSIAYKALREDVGMTFGKSEKLRAIARTAADDAGMEPESQLSFPAFSPLFKFPEEEEKKTVFGRKKDKKSKNESEEKQPFDIDESEIVTSHTENEDVEETPEELNEDSLDKKHRTRRIFETIGSEELQETEPAFEMASKSDIRSTLRHLTKNRRVDLIKTALIIILGAVLGVLTVILSEGSVLAVISMVFLILSGVVCIKELADGVRDILKLKLSYNFAGLLIFAVAIIQTLSALLSSSGTEANFAPTAIFSFVLLTVPKILLADNARYTVKIISGSGGVSLFKPLSEGGIEGSVQMQYASDERAVRCSVSAEFLTGLIKKLTNAIPKPFAGNAVFVISIVLSLIVGIASGIINGSFYGAVTGFSGMLFASLPISYTMCASYLLLRTNKGLSKNRSGLISYKSACSLVDTSAVVLSDNDIIEGVSCSIHDTKTFGRTDPKTAAMCCAAVMNSANMPIFEIMKKTLEDIDDGLPQADDYIISSKGVAALYDNKKILLGTKEFLTENHVYVSDENFEEKYVTGDRKLLYLSVNGEFCMLLIVSYHIKRSVANFLKYISGKGLKIIIHSCDPNITSGFVEKKCRLQKESVIKIEETETAYFKDKASKMESSLPAEVFTDGKIASLELLLKNAFTLEKSANTLPVIMFMLSVFSALAVAVPALLGNIGVVGNVYIVILRLISLLLGIGVPILLFKEK